MATAVIVSGYVPPFAAASSTSVSTTSAAATAVQTIRSQTYEEYFIVPYLDAHVLSPSSYRYAYIFWIVVAAVLVVFSIMNQCNISGSAVGAMFRKFSMRRITLRGKPKPAATIGDGSTKPKPKRIRSYATMTAAQFLSVSLLLVLVALLSILGDDYISPTTCVFGGTCSYQGGGPPQTTFAARAVRCSSAPDPIWVSPAPPLPAHLPYGNSVARAKHPREIVKRQNTPAGWAAFNDPLLAAPNSNIAANWWTAGNRLGLIAVAMLPLCTSFALKQWPYNIWASPFLTDYHFDKTALMHRWSGRIIWLVTTAHVVTWTYQLFIDKDPFGRPVFYGAWIYWRFKMGAVAYVFLCLVVAMSFNPLRKRFYEAFYYSHVVLVAALLVTTILHFEYLAYWSYAALGLWGAERFTRLVLLAKVNVIRPSAGPIKGGHFELLGVEKQDGYIDAESWSLGRQSAAASYPPSSINDNSNLRYLDPSAPRTAHSTSPPVYASPPVHTSSSLPPPGYARAQLLPGQTVRLTLTTPGTLRWLPGQHVTLTIPSVAMFQGHPYTILSVDEHAKGVTPLAGLDPNATSPIVLLIRAQRGFSKGLWDAVLEKRRKKELMATVRGDLSSGVDLRALVSWPTGSSARTSWGDYASVVVVSGGTGCSFGISIVEYLCRRMARRDAMARGKVDDPESSKFKTTRVRFVWILREHAHIAWIAPTLRRCLEMVQPYQLQVDLYVTREDVRSRHSQAKSSTSFDDYAPLATPSAPFAQRPEYSRSDSTNTIDSQQDTVYESKKALDLYAQLDLEFESPADLVMFDGEEDSRTTAEVELSTRVRKAGQLRRKETRKLQKLNKLAGGAGEVPDYRKRADMMPGARFAQSPPATLSGHHSRTTSQDITLNDDSSDSPRRNMYNRSYSANESLAELAGEDSHSLAGDSMRNLIHGSRARPGMRDERDDTPLDVSEQDQDDLEAVAVLARDGYPALDKVLDEEVDRAEGKAMVACCGPASLNTIVRNLVSDRISMSKIMRGDVTGQLSLIVEDFAY